ncbi:hypothetical protein BBJ29_008594 [Phytophthora kernoviae]|uniref:Tubulin-specific chaperone A n=1 Tax=Phytophthora kernoviae TaxID=325452 RepID=A0A3F2RDB8_9STRA|nr:hypothetical protein BBJ29_008594 [Phytophthora kernoviae]RLN53825.1 hypothetical protein BBP00_00009186 [Phytophthora kernoviae]
MLQGLRRTIGRYTAPRAKETDLSALHEDKPEDMTPDDADRCVGGEYKEAARRIERDVAERMEQSVRFTVLDPLRDRLERHTVLQEQICVRDNLATECKALRALVQRLPTLRLEDDDKRVQTYSRLDKVIGELKEVEKKLLPLLEDAIQSDSTSSTENLFNAMVR